MFGILLAAGIILVIGILIMMFRLEVLVDIVKRKSGKPGHSNKINAFLFMAFGIVGVVWILWYSWAEFDRYNLPLASKHGAETDELFWITTAITGVVFIITNILLFYFSFKYQHQEGKRAKFYPHNNKLELIWTVLPAIALAVLISKGLIVWGDIMEKAPDDAEVIEVMGYQFAWDVRYPGKDNSFGDYDFRLIDGSNLFGLDLEDDNSYDDFSALEIHIPKGKTVLVNIRARDVLHSFYLPHFRVKMDAVPGMQTHFKFEATKTTAEMRAELNDPEFNYELACAEICGRGHFSMRKIVVVDELEDYEKWKAQQKAWLKLNPDYLSKVPAAKREAAIIKAGITKEELNASL
ncbi:MAG: cytochrome c oxidase subunit II [Cyclobacteriaceae bacterium]|nr:cytochrome c oxidase subunit II [Cyclobacteriaceae bacterium]